MAQLEKMVLKSSELSPGFQIQRALPQRGLRRVGAWAFLDHIGPVQLSPTLGMHVHSHPHIGLSTFTWMISGEIQHHDSLGHNLAIKPGQVNLMTAGNGIAHTEVSIGESGCMHAAQLWIALPEHAKDIPASFQNYPELPQIASPHLTETVLIGQWQDCISPVTAHTPIVGVDLHAQADYQQTFELNPEFEYGFLPMIGDLNVNGECVKTGEFAYLPTGETSLSLQASAGSRALLIGGEPLDEELILWWNLIARTQAEIEQARADWEAQSPRYGELAQLGDGWLHAPELTGNLIASKGQR